MEEGEARGVDCTTSISAPREEADDRFPNGLSFKDEGENLDERNSGEEN